MFSIRKLKSFVNNIGVEREVLSNISLRLLQIITQLILIFSISSKFSSVELGYYYVLNSYAGMSIFFELGMSAVIMQNAAHESAKISKELLFVDNNGLLSKLSSLFHFICKWQIIASILFLVIIYSSSFFFFNVKQTHENQNIHWQVPLLVLLLSISISIIINGIYSFLEGCLFVFEISIVRIIQNISFIILFVIFIISNLGLLAYGLAQLFSLLLAVFFLSRQKVFIALRNIYKSVSDENSFNWMQDIFPLQWRVAMSSISGYFIFQIADLFAFKYQGPVLSGQLGFTMSLVNGIVIVSSVWTSSRSPMYANLVANNKINDLQTLFKRTIFSSIITFLFLGIAFFVFKLLFIDYYKLVFVGRLLNNYDTLLILLYSMCNVIIFSLAAYCRSNKEEPFLAPSVIGAVWGIFTSFLVLKYLTMQWFCFLLVFNNLIIGIPWAIWIYNKMKQKFLVKSFNYTS
jgi:hypothetical protein